MKIIPFVDHAIGALCLERLLGEEVEIPFVVTTRANATGWWKSAEAVVAGKGLEVKFYEDTPPEVLLGSRPDIVLLLSWKYVLPPVFFTDPTITYINLHYSLLPEFRGVYPVNWAIISGRSETGVTFHLVSGEVDSGPLLLQRSIQITPTDTAGSLLERLDAVASDLFGELLRMILRGEALVGSPQEELSGYFSRRRFDAIRQIDLDENKEFARLFDLLRGLTFNPKEPILVLKKNGKSMGVSLNVTEIEE